MENAFELKQKKIIITGASSGIGEQCAISCSKMGATVILVARNEERLKKVLKKLEGNNHSFYKLELQDFDRYPTIINNIVAQHGKISGLIHSAGIEASAPLNVLDPVKLKNTFEINAFSFFEFTRLLSKNKNHDENTSFVAISSVMGFLGEKGKLAYCSSKAALINGVKALALELAKKNIRVNCISPAIVETKMVKELFSKMADENRANIEEMHPLGLGNTEDVANACIYLISNASRWVTGANLIVDGGYSAH